MDEHVDVTGVDRWRQAVVESAVAVSECAFTEPRRTTIWEALWWGAVCPVACYVALLARMWLCGVACGLVFYSAARVVLWIVGVN